MARLVKLDPSRRRHPAGSAPEPVRRRPPVCVIAIGIFAVLVAGTVGAADPVPVLEHWAVPLGGKAVRQVDFEIFRVEVADASVALASWEAFQRDVEVKGEKIGDTEVTLVDAAGRPRLVLHLAVCAAKVFAEAEALQRSLEDVEGLAVYVAEGRVVVEGVLYDRQLFRRLLDQPRRDLEMINNTRLSPLVPLAIGDARGYLRATFSLDETRPAERLAYHTAWLRFADVPVARLRDSNRGRLVTRARTAARIANAYLDAWMAGMAEGKREPAVFTVTARKGAPEAAFTVRAASLARLFAGETLFTVGADDVAGDAGAEPGTLAKRGAEYFAAVFNLFLRGERPALADAEPLLDLHSRAAGRSGGLPSALDVIAGYHAASLVPGFQASLERAALAGVALH